MVVGREAVRYQRGVNARKAREKKGKRGERVGNEMREGKGGDSRGWESHKGNSECKARTYVAYDQGRCEVYTLLSHEFQGRLVNQVAMLDPADTRFHSVPSALRGETMGRDEGYALWSHRW